MPRKPSRPINDKDWAKAFSQVINKPLQPQGEGWKTQQDISKQFKMGRIKAYKAIKALIEQGRLEVFRGIVYINNRPARRQWYRLIA